MGWTFPYGMTRQELATQIVGDYKNEGKYLDHSFGGNKLFVLIKTSAPDCTENGKNPDGAVILVYLFRQMDGSAGYKDMDESMGPYECGCPERILKKSTCMHENAVEWRARCIESNKQDRETKKFYDSIVPGDSLKLGSGKTVQVTATTYRGRKCILGYYDGGSTVYRFPRRHLKGATKIS